MNEHLRDRILRRLETLSDERGYQLLDYAEFLESKYAEKAAPASQNLLQKFAEGVEDRLRAGRVSAQTIGDTMTLMNKAIGMLSGVAAAGKSVANDIVSAASAATSGMSGAAGAPGTTGTAGTAGTTGTTGTTGGATTGATSAPSPGSTTGATRPPAPSSPTPPAAGGPTGGTTMPPTGDSTT